MFCFVANIEHAATNFLRMLRSRQQILTVHLASDNFCVCSEYDKTTVAYIRPKFQFLFCCQDLRFRLHKKLSEENIRFGQL
jgi:hypothetical protein